MENNLPALIASCALGGALGSALRFSLSHFLDYKNALPRKIPLGTLLANLIAAFVLGHICAHFPSGPDAHVSILLGAGLCGALSTFSALAFQLYIMLEERRFLRAAVYMLLTFPPGAALFTLGKMV